MLSMFSWPEKQAQSDGGTYLWVATTAEIQGQPPLMCLPGPLSASEPEEMQEALLKGRGIATVTLLALSQSWALGPALLSLKL